MSIISRAVARINIINFDSSEIRSRISRVVDGRFVETRNYYDNVTILSQLGYTITPPSAEGEEQ